MFEKITERFFWIILPGLPLTIVCGVRALGIFTSNTFYHNKENLEILKSLGSFVSTFGFIIFIAFCYSVGFVINDISKRIWRCIRDRYGKDKFYTQVLDDKENSSDVQKLGMRELSLITGILISSLVGIAFELCYKISDFGQSFILIMLVVVITSSITFLLFKPILRMIKHHK